MIRSGLLVFAISCLAGAAWADPAYKLSVSAPAATHGQKAVAKIQITPGAGYHMNKEYPTSVVLKEIPAGVTVDKLKQTAKDAVKLEEAAAEFDVGFTATEGGKKTLTGELKFAVCSANSCDPKKEALSITVDVK